MELKSAVAIVKARARVSSNRTFMELKSDEGPRHKQMFLCSNRTFMELKLESNAARVSIIS